jgi:hypothetical protein
MREIARHDHKGEVVVVAVDRLDSGLKPLRGIERVETTTGMDEVRVDQDNKLH